MNKLNFSNTGGFPLDTNILAYMQDAYDLLNALGEISGNLSILKGCNVTGSVVSDGVVFINGEVLKFKGGTGTQVIIREDVTELTFEDGSSKEVEKVRYATFGIASTSYLWNDFVRAQRAIVPRGLISMWSGSVDKIPRGWFICDGNNETPDLRDKFLVGAGLSYNVGDVGGEKLHALTTNEMPAHVHNIGSAGSHYHQFKNYYFVENSDLDDGRIEAGFGYDEIETGIGSKDTDHDNNRVFFKFSVTETEEDHTHPVSQSGSGSAHENRPPFYALAYIMFKG